MVKPLLRSRVVTAVDEGLPCRQATARFGVSASSAIRWRMLQRNTGDARAKPQGGDRRSARIEACAGLVLGRWRRKFDITLHELKALLAERGIGVGIGTLWRFFDRRRITLKKSRRMWPSRNALTS